MWRIRFREGFRLVFWRDFLAAVEDVMQGAEDSIEILEGVEVGL